MRIRFLALATLLVQIMLCLGMAADIDTGGRTSLPIRHVIENFPWHQQMNGLFCGEGVLEGVYDYYGPDINQKAIANVARSSSAGTWSFDMVRAGHFSSMSSARGRFFPHEIPVAGYAERALGYASFPYSSDRFWLEDLKALIAADAPVILLMTYDPDGGGGHYRTAIGYDDAKGLIYFSDPWGRDQKHQTNKTGITAWTYEELQGGWNYTAAGESHPHWAMVTMPWDIRIRILGSLKPGSMAIVAADIAYPCPGPFSSFMYPAKDSVAMITLPEGMSLESESLSAPLGEIRAGSTVRASWKVRVDGSVSGESIGIRAWGTVSGQVPEAHWTGESVAYPPYGYNDAIGGEGSIQL